MRLAVIGSAVLVVLIVITLLTASALVPTLADGDLRATALVACGVIYFGVSAWTVGRQWWYLRRARA